MRLLSPKQMAAEAKENLDATYAEIADEIGYSKSAVGSALSNPSRRRVKMLARILEAQGRDVRLVPHYPVSD